MWGEVEPHAFPPYMSNVVLDFDNIIRGYCLIFIHGKYHGKQAIHSCSGMKEICEILSILWNNWMWISLTSVDYLLCWSSGLSIEFWGYKFIVLSCSALRNLVPIWRKKKIPFNFLRKYLKGYREKNISSHFPLG